MQTVKKPTFLLNWKLSDLFAWETLGTEIFTYLALKGKFQFDNSFSIYDHFDGRYEVALRILMRPETKLNLTILLMKALIKKNSTNRIIYLLKNRNIKIKTSNETIYHLCPSL